MPRPSDCALPLEAEMRRVESQSGKLCRITYVEKSPTNILAQREWDKVWREQTQKAYWRSLDHQAIASKATDKKLFVAKHIQNEIQSKFEDARGLRKSGFKVPRHQFEFTFDDPAVIRRHSVAITLH